MLYFRFEDFNQLPELKEWVDDMTFFRIIEDYYRDFKKLSDDSLDKMAYFRVIEITNGCVQHAFRAKADFALGVDETRESMKLSMGFIKNAYLDIPTLGGRIDLTEQEKAILFNGRQLYINAFKQPKPNGRKLYYANSVAMLFCIGAERIKKAQEIIDENFINIFTPEFIRIGKRYLAPYLYIITNSIKTEVK
ncbi:MAG: hypothetical protein R3321_03730 [Nitrososphaeraceae archaeon]|nr:hypothetical protein [Nitrososphaeraceae archaeon]